jgi:hypothetical protein
MNALSLSVVVAQVFPLVMPIAEATPWMVVVAAYRRYFRMK